MDINKVEDAIETINTLIDPADLAVALSEFMGTESVLNSLNEDTLCDYVKEHFDVDDVYEASDIEAWFLDNNDIEDYVDSDDIINQFIENNDPDEVFGTNYMWQWLHNNWYDDIVDNIRENKSPDEVFTHEELEEWAKENGWVMKEEE